MVNDTNKIKLELGNLFMLLFLN